MNAGVQNRTIKTAPPAYKGIIMTVLMNLTGQPVEAAIQVMRELTDPREWEIKSAPAPTERASRSEQKEENNRI